MSSTQKLSFYRKSLLAFLTCSAVMFAGCNAAERSNVKVAGGEIDGSNGDPSKYPATVYVELNGVDFDNQKRIIRNVGTVLDIGMSGRYALILSLADIFEGNSGVAVMPLMKQLQITLYPSNGAQKAVLPQLNMIKGGFFQGGGYSQYFMMSVGVLSNRTGKSTADIDAKVGNISGRIFIEGQLKTEQGRNLRDAFTSYTMLAIPKTEIDNIPGFKAASLMLAEDRPDSKGLKGVMVGFGERAAGADNSGQNGFALSDELPSVMARNFASIESLNQTPDKLTPFRQLQGNAPDAIKQLWEISGSGLCGTKDRSNYDTGAAVYVNDKFAGFGVRSTTISSGFLGSLVCGSTARSNMATLIVSPSKLHVDEFIFRADGRDIAP